jgi:probable rRNA maturation factor
MILLDPDLDFGAPPKRQAATRPAGSGSIPKDIEIPSTRALTLFLRRAQAVARLRGEVNVLLTTDNAIRKLNRKFRGKNKATDVLSFPAGSLVRNQEKGDLAISVETARRQGAARGHSLGTEIKILILHGLLHLAGYDHETDTGQMARREQMLHKKLGLREGLIERVAARGSRARAAR